MPDQETGKPAAATPSAPAAPKPPTTPAAPTAPVEDYVERHGRDGWLERAAWFNERHSRHALAGALHDLGDEEISQDEVQGRLDKYLRPGGKAS